MNRNCLVNYDSICWISLWMQPPMTSVHTYLLVVCSCTYGHKYFKGWHPWGINVASFRHYLKQQNTLIWCALFSLLDAITNKKTVQLEQLNTMPALLPGIPHFLAIIITVPSWKPLITVPQIIKVTASVECWVIAMAIVSSFMNFRVFSYVMVSNIKKHCHIWELCWFYSLIISTYVPKDEIPIEIFVSVLAAAAANDWQIRYSSITGDTMTFLTNWTAPHNTL